MGIPDVVGIAEIAERLGVTKSRADQISRQRHFPLGKKLKMGTVYERTDVEAWIAKHRPQLAEEPEGDA